MKNNITPSEGWEKEIKNYECREYNGIKWIRYDHYLDALSSQLKEVVGVIESKRKHCDAHYDNDCGGCDLCKCCNESNQALDDIKAEVERMK